MSQYQDSQNHHGYDEDLRGHLARLARFGANMTDAHSCVIFLPGSILSHRGRTSHTGAKKLGIGGFHSLSTTILTQSVIHAGNGLIGWVAQHEKAVHVSPFEHDSRTLGYYQEECELKSFIAIPIAFPSPQGRDIGVIACDSKKSFAFSKLQGRLLEDLADEIRHLVGFIRKSHSSEDRVDDWDSFRSLTRTLIESLGSDSVEMLRIGIDNYRDIERHCGMSSALAMATQLYRLFQQALPPHFPIFRLPNGDITVMVDRMMRSFYQNKFEALARHVNENKHSLSLSFSAKSVQQTPEDSGELLQETGLLQGTGTYEYR